MDRQHITLISFGYFEKDLLVKVAEAVSYEFKYAVKIKEGHLDLSEYYDPGRRQYNGNQLLELIDALVLQDAAKTIGLFNVDLFIPILTYIFGQAVLGGNTGIASFYRLNNERYGMPPDKYILLERFKKEVVHEIGHTFGLIHCHTPTCVMRSSTYVEDIDLKEVHMCQECRKALKY
jgi:archaemetzincin